jgi:type IV pilus assembly protein PilB
MPKVMDSNMLLNYAREFNFPLAELNHETALALFQENMLSLELIKQYQVFPLAKKDNTLHIGMTDLTNQSAIDAIIFHTGMRVQPALMSENQLNEWIKCYCYLPNSKSLEVPLLQEMFEIEDKKTFHDNIANNDEPLVKFVNNLLMHALHKTASDIHIEPYETNCRIRFRQDGILYEIAEIPSHLAIRLITRLKVMAKLDISERRLPQDGRLQFALTPQQLIDIRINTCPILFGEKIVLRIVDNRNVSLKIENLGFSESQKNIFLAAISQPQGMILVTGPTGSGKTVTLYSALHHINTSEKNISTAEDPIEIYLPGINQVCINPKVGLTFATTLRTFLRQDPDIIMVGEMRDSETADIAIQAAQTGHLVLSTAHTNSAAETLTRLQAMGVSNYNLKNSISLIIAQRLIRKLCLHCKEEELIQQEFVSYRAKGCKQCLQGYQGRIGIYEFLPLTSPHSHEKFPTLYESALEKVKQGITSFSEINRVIGE